MADGEIAQVGTGREIYRSPRTRFVAEFVGRNNILSGRVQGQSGERLEIETAIGRFQTNGSRAVGSDVEMVIAADMIEFGAGENTAEAKVVSEEFVGSMVTVFLEAQDGTEFKVQLQERARSELDLSPGAQTQISWPISDVHLLPEATK